MEKMPLSTNSAQPSHPLAQRYLKQYGILLKTPEQLEKIRRACQVTALILDRLCQEAKEGITTLYLDQTVASSFIKNITLFQLP
jgi:hypothetical protein